MRKLIPVGLLLLALVVGFFLPRGYMLILDETLADPEAFAAEEPILGTDIENAEETEKLLKSRTVARRLAEFRDGVVVVPNDMLDHEADSFSISEEAIEMAIVLLNDLVEEPLYLHETMAVDMLALLSDNVVIRVWQVEIHFNSGWIADMMVDMDNRALLQLEIHNGDGMALWRLFREADANMTKSELVEHVARHTADSLSGYMGANPTGRVEVISDRKKATVTFEGNPPTAVEVPLTVELYRGISFNVGSES